MPVQYDPLNCTIHCTDMMQCMQDTDRIICEIRCDKCGMGNRFRLEGFFVSMLKQYGEASCQMGRKIYRTKDETCDACKAGGELLAKVEEAPKVEPVVVPENLRSSLDEDDMQDLSMGCQIPTTRADALNQIGDFLDKMKSNDFDIKGA